MPHHHAEFAGRQAGQATLSPCGEATRLRGRLFQGGIMPASDQDLGQAALGIAGDQMPGGSRLV
jgi:hypothetical protein